MEQHNIFPYDWNLINTDDEELDHTLIRVYGLNEKNETIVLLIRDFQPYVYVEVPSYFKEQHAIALKNIFLEKLKPTQHPTSIKLVLKKKLYGADFDMNGERKLFPFLHVTFKTPEHIKAFGKLIRFGKHWPGLGNMRLKIHEDNAHPVLQLCCKQNVPVCGWISFEGIRKIKRKETRCKYEYEISYKKLKTNTEILIVPNPVIMAYDLEVYSSVRGSMPKYFRPDDEIFQISVVVGRQGSGKYEAILLTLGEPDPDTTGDEVEIRMFQTEADLIVGFTQCIQEFQPNVITGYNIFEFDIDYMIKRSKFRSCFYDFAKQGLNLYGLDTEKSIEWGSSAFKNQKFLYLHAEGRLFVDLLPVVRRDYKFSTYKLKEIAATFLGETKDPLTPEGIFRCYRIGMKGLNSQDKKLKEKGMSALGICAKYCIQDSVLVYKLFEKIQTWVGLIEMARICNTQIFFLFTQGQQIKVFSQVYKKCLEENYVVEKDGFQAGENESYTGAHVFEPMAGVWDWVVPLDFCLTGDTLVNMSNGCSKKLENFKEGEKVQCYDESLKTITRNEIVGDLQIKGEKEVVKVFLQDGRIIECTPEHKFLCEEGKWVEAQNLEGKYILCGLENPEDKIGNDEDSWELCTNYIFNMRERREQTLAFSRILGYILSDDNIYKINNKLKNYNRRYAETYLRTLVDAEKLLEDIRKIILTEAKIRERNGNSCEGSEIKGQTYNITLPEKLTNIIHSLKGIVVGKRSSQRIQLPDFIKEDNCPLAIVREFLAGLFGRDGIAPCYHLKNGKFKNIIFKLTTIEKYKENMKSTMEDIIKLLDRFEIKCNQLNCIKVKYGKNSIKPKDDLKNPRWDYYFSIKNDFTYAFANLIGFRYCVNKNYKLTIASLFTKMTLKAREQFNFIVNRTNEIINEKIGEKILTRIKDGPTFTDCLELARNELREKEIPLSEVVLASVNNINYFREEIRKGISLSYLKGFINGTKFLEETGTRNWFNKNEYVVKGDSKILPIFKQKVIGVQNSGIKKVYDIEVKEQHNFFGNGLVVHNCSLYPSIIIAKNICWSTWVKDDSNIPDELCHIFDWHDHFGCEHDTVKRATKKIICEPRYYRFLKEPKGVLPILLENLLGARNAVKGQIKETVKVKNKSPEKAQELDTKLVVLDKRQLALKISANSVRGDTPIPCCFEGKFRYMTIEEISNGNWVLDGEYEISSPLPGLKVWSDQGFTNIKFVMRHLKTEPLRRVLIHTGVVDCTEDHSLLKYDGKPVKPRDLVIGDFLLTHELPLPEDVPKKPLFLSVNRKDILSFELENLEEYKAFGWGFFFAEGTSGSYGDVGKTKNNWCIYNQDLDYLKKVKDCFERVETDYSFNLSRERYSGNVYHLCPRIKTNKNIVEFADKYRELFYDRRGSKRIPYEIFNSPYKTRLAFFMGYYAGDGNRHLKIGIVITNKGAIGCADLVYLMRSLGYLTSISNPIKDNLYRIQCCTKFRFKKHDAIKNMYKSCEPEPIKTLKPKIIRNQNLIKFDENKNIKYRGIIIKCERIVRQKLLNFLDDAIEKIKNRNADIVEYSTSKKRIKYRMWCCKKEFYIQTQTLKQNKLVRYDHICDCKNNGTDEGYNNLIEYEDIVEPEYVYDLETENHHFSAGVGNIVVHNSMYGIMGVRKGYLPFMPGAMCVTAFGRESIQKTSKLAIEKFGLVRIYGDSVTGDTPLLLRDNKRMISIRSIESLSKEWFDYEGFKPGQNNRKEKQQAMCDLEIWSVDKQTKKGRWTKIKRVIRHKSLKKLYRVNTRIGCVDVTEDHSLLNMNCEKVKPGELKVGDELLHSFPETEYYLNSGTNLSEEEAWVWGFFMANGSCGSCKNKTGVKNTWVINNHNLKHLERAKKYFENCEPHLGFKILDTIKSSDVYKLVPTRNLGYIYQKYQDLFYYKKYKIVPDIVLNSLKEVKSSFLEGYYGGDGSKTDQCGWGKDLQFCCKGKIGAQCLYYLLKSLGYNANIRVLEDKMDVYRITTSKKIGKSPNHVKRIIDLGETKEGEFVYDIETEDGNFLGGVGSMILKNTDSVYVVFPDQTDPKVIWDKAIEVADKISEYFPPPMKLQFEMTIYKRFMILTKKRYMSIECDRNGVEKSGISKKGVMLARRDNSKAVRDIYSATVMDIFNKVPEKEVIENMIENIIKMVRGELHYKEFIITKRVGEISEYKIRALPDDEKKRQIRLDSLECQNEQEYKIKALPAQAQLLLKMQSRGENVGAGTRLEYIVTTTGGHKARQFMKIEDANYFMRHTSVLKIDYLYYVHNLSTQMDQVLEVVYGRKKFVKELYKDLLQTFTLREKLVKNFEKYLYSIDFKDEKPKKKVIFVFEDE
jgi:DNA polymerase elongation subunit (family B)